MVPPRWSSPRVELMVSCSTWASRTPFHPLANPKVATFAWSARRTVARMAAFSPGQSPPPVRMPMRETMRDVLGSGSVDGSVGILRTPPRPSSGR